MDRSEYLETEDGQRRERRKRVAKRQNYVISDHEPKSKKSISDQEKVQFQQQILAQMQKAGRRAFRSPVILEIDFDSHQNDPPAIHTLAKNYMDLLQEPVEGSGIKRNRLVLTDDRCIDILIVNYHLRQLPNPGIRLRVDTVSNFVQDLALLERISGGNFSDCSRHDMDSLWDEDGSAHAQNKLRDAIEVLRDWQDRRAEIEARWGVAAFESMHRMNVVLVQELYLEAFEPKVRDLRLLLRPLLSRDSEIESLNAQMRDMIVTPPFMLDLTHAPVEGAGKDVFKASVGNAVATFKTQHPLLFPLLTPVGVTILCVPPENQAVEGKEQYVDLDNLARYIIPSVHEVLQPPTDTVHTFDVSAITDDQLRKLFTERLERLKRTPTHSVIQYQMIRLPRLAGDPKNGLVRLALGKGGPSRALWHRMDQIIGRWEG